MAWIYNILMVAFSYSASPSAAYLSQERMLDLCWILYSGTRSILIVNLMPVCDWIGCL